MDFMGAILEGRPVRVNQKLNLTDEEVLSGRFSKARLCQCVFISSCGFGVIERLICAFHPSLYDLVFTKFGDAHRNGEFDLYIIHHKGFTADAIHGLICFLKSMVKTAFWKEDGKFFSSHAGNKVTFSGKDLFQQSYTLNQNQVSGLMTVAVVDVFKMIDIQ